MSKAVDVSIILVNYNVENFLRECLKSIEDNVTDKVSYEIIVVDNASTDGSVGMLKKGFPHVKLIASKENLGFARGNNAGIKISSGRYVLFLNTDTVIYKHTLERMVGFMDEHKDCGASTCYLEMPNGQLDDAAHRGYPTPWNAFCHFSGISGLFSKSMLLNGYHLGWKDLDKVHEIDALAGAFMLVPRKAGEEVGWWDEDYFFYGEDIDFCYKLKQKGYKIYFVPDVKILHYKGVAGGLKKISKNITTATKETKIRLTNCRFDAMKIFYKKNYEKKYPKFLKWLILQGIEGKRYLTLRGIN